MRANNFLAGLLLRHCPGRALVGQRLYEVLGSAEAQGPRG